MSDRRYKTIVVVVVLVVIVAAVTWKAARREAARRAGGGQAPVAAVPYESEDTGRDSGPQATAPVAPGQPEGTSSEAAPPADEAASRRLPRLVDLGRGKCIPCKAMKPILDELTREYEGRVEVQVIDIGEDPGAAQKHGVLFIPTQIFFDADGEEVYRHTGFMSKEDIVAKFEEMGFK